MMTIEQKMDKYIENRAKLTEIYIEQNNISKDIIDHFIENKHLFKEVELEKHLMEIKWIHEKFIDYEKLEQEYPEIYVLGLRPEFSRRQLLKVVDKKQAELILRECTLNSSAYELRVKKNREYYNRRRREKREREKTNNS